MECPIDLQSGIVIGSYTGVDEDDIQVRDEVQTAGADNSSRRCPVPDHLTSLYQQAATNCASNDEKKQMANLLKKYRAVFSTGDNDIGLTNLVKHTIPVVEGTRPIRQPPHRLGPEKEKLADEQVADLLKRGLIEPSNAAWSSPVVLVRKKDGDGDFA
jgi:hypothetical protein